MGKTGRVDKENVIRMYKEGYSADDIATANGCKYGYVIKILNMAGIFRRWPVDKGRIRALAKAGWSVPEIAKDCHCSEEEVRENLL